MNAALPDVASHAAATSLNPLNWVGMAGIDLPITLAEPDCRREAHARADIQVDSPEPDIKGIHMSRLYRLLDTLSDGDVLTVTRLRRLLQAMIDSHDDCLSRNARVRLNFELMARRPALLSEGLSGWQSYPAHLDASLVDGVFALRTQVTVIYASVCPCSAALSRQKIAQGFLSAFDGQTQVAPSVVAAWLNDHATLAVPHGQRSMAEVDVPVTEDAPTLGLAVLIDRIEQALATPVQTIVKRADEQAFAARSGQNTMFVEDAARLIQSALSADYRDPRIHVRHFESLHPHDAVARAGTGGSAP